MKKIFSVALLFLSIVTFSQGSVMIAATDGGSVTLTPTGVIKNAPTKVAPAPAKTPGPLKGTGKLKVADLDTYTFTDLSVDDARMIRNSLASVYYDENANAMDVKAMLDVRAFIVTNKDFKNSTKKLTLTVSAEKAENIFSTIQWVGNYGNTQEQIQAEYNRNMNNLNLKKKIIAQADDAEKKKGVSKENSRVNRYKRYEDQ